MPPLFVDGVEIRELFVDGVEQSVMFVDGVQVYSSEISFDFVERALPQPSVTLRAAAVDPNGVFVALGDTTPGSDVYAVSSPDGDVFTERTVPFGTGGDHDVVSVTYGDNQFYATGGSSNSNRAYCLTAVGEGNWIERPTYPNFAVGGGIAYKPDGTSIYATNIGNSAYHSSPTAQSWTARGNQVGAPLNRDSQYYNGFFVAVGFNFAIPGPGAARIDTSTNAINWTLIAVPQNLVPVTAGVAYSPELDRWVIVGDAMSNGDPYIITAESTPTSGWTLRSNPLPINCSIKAVAFIPEYGFIVVGALTGNAGCLIASSVDGITWGNVLTHPFQSVANTQYVKVKEHDGKIVIFGNHTDTNVSFAVSNL